MMIPDLYPYLHPALTLLAALLPVVLAGLKARGEMRSSPSDGGRARDPP